MTAPFGVAMFAFALCFAVLSGVVPSAHTDADYVTMSDLALSAGAAQRAVRKVDKVEANRRMTARANIRLPQQSDFTFPVGSENAADSISNFATLGLQGALYLCLIRHGSVRAPPLVCLLNKD